MARRGSVMVFSLLLLCLYYDFSNTYLNNDTQNIIRSRGADKLTASPTSSDPTTVSPTSSNLTTASPTTVSCDFNTFDSYYRLDFLKSRFVPFDSSCLKQIIRSHPENLHLRIAHLRRRYFESMRSRDPSRLRHMIYYCDRSCGGHGDRVRAMARVFYYALAFNATFSIIVEQPRWDAYFEEFDDLETIGSRSLFRSLVSEGVIRIDQNSKKLDFKKYFLHKTVDRLPEDRTFHLREMDRKTSNFESFYDEAGVLDQTKLFPGNATAPQYVVIQSNWDLKPCFTGSMLDEYAIRDLEHGHLMHIFLQLYASKLLPDLSKAVRGPESILKDKYVVGMHFRLGASQDGANITWNDPKRHSASKIPCLVKHAIQLCSLHHARNSSTPDCALLVVSDSAESLELVKRLVNGTGILAVSPAGSIYHLDRSNFSELSVIADNMKMFVDWLLLGKRSDTLILSRSGFSTSASFLISNGTNLHYRPTYIIDENGVDSCIKKSFHSPRNSLAIIPKEIGSGENVD